LVKPFELAELVMRIRALVDRSNISDVVHIENIDVFIDENRCVKDGQEVHLTLKERQILVELVDANGRTVSRADIVESIW
jgi:DNA-binding response OmpR family regulator